MLITLSKQSVQNETGRLYTIQIGQICDIDDGLRFDQCQREIIWKTVFQSKFLIFCFSRFYPGVCKAQMTLICVRNVQNTSFWNHRWSCKFQSTAFYQNMWFLGEKDTFAISKCQRLWIFKNWVNWICPLTINITIKYQKIVSHFVFFLFLILKQLWNDSVLPFRLTYVSYYFA